MDKVKLKDLVLDYTIYPRNDVSGTHVQSLCDAFLSGSDIPPLVVDRKSKRIVDGFHRYKMHDKLKHEIVEVILKDYRSEAEIFADSVRLNAAHGRAFDNYDKGRAVLKLKDFGYSEEEIAKIAFITPERIQKIELNTGTIPSGERIVIKNGLRLELVGENLNKKEIKLNESWSGMNPAFHARQILDMLKANIIPKSPAFHQFMDEIVNLWSDIRVTK
jgi:hypothetical protein